MQETELTCCQLNQSTEPYKKVQKSEFPIRILEEWRTLFNNEGKKQKQNKN